EGQGAELRVLRQPGGGAGIPRRPHSRGDPRWAARGGSRRRARPGFADHALRQPGHAEGCGGGARRARAEEAPPPRAWAHRGRELLVRLLLAVLIAAALLPGCSALRAGYENADTLLRWRLTSYLDVHDEQ